MPLKPPKPRELPRKPPQMETATRHVRREEDPLQQKIRDVLANALASLGFSITGKPTVMIDRVGSRNAIVILDCVVPIEVAERL